MTTRINGETPREKAMREAREEFMRETGIDPTKPMSTIEQVLQVYEKYKEKMGWFK